MDLIFLISPVGAGLAPALLLDPAPPSYLTPPYCVLDWTDYLLDWADYLLDWADYLLDWADYLLDWADYLLDWTH